MTPSDVCKMCGKVNRKEWVIWSHEQKTIKTCKACKEQHSSGISSAYYEKAKKRVEDERCANNAQTLRLYHILPKKK